MKTRLLCCSLVFAAGLAYSEDQKPVSSVQIQGQGSAAGTEIVLNQIAMDQFPAVHAFVTVLKDGKPQSGLTAADFRVREDEVDEQPLTVESQLPPLSVVIAIDNSGSMRPRLPETRAAAKSFLEILAPADSVQVVGFAQQVKVLGAMSSNRGAAGKAIELTTARGNTALYDALFTSVDLLKDRPGRKAVVLLSDGVDDNGVGKQLSKHSIQDVLQFAKRVNVPIYAIGIGTEIDEALLAGFAQSTGGRYGQDSNSKPGITSRTTPETKKKSVNAPDWLPVPDGAKELSYSATGAQKQLILTVDQPVNDVADFFQQRLTEQGLHIVTASNGNAQTLLVTGSGKNAEIEIASQGENQTIVRIALNGE